MSGGDRGSAIVATLSSAPLSHLKYTEDRIVLRSLVYLEPHSVYKYSINPHYPCIGVLGPSAPAPATAMSARNTTTGGGDRAGEELAGMEKRHRSCYRAKLPLGVPPCHVERAAEGATFFAMFRIVAEWPQLGSRCETRSVDQWSKLATERIYITQQMCCRRLAMFREMPSTCT